MKNQTTALKKDTMSKTSTPLWILLGGIFALMAGLAIVSTILAKKRDTEDELMPAPASVSDASRNTFRCLNRNYPLRLGTCHKDVRVLQRFLKKAGAALGNTGENFDGIDGQFGEVTLAAAKKHLNKERFNHEDITTLRKQL
jgi:peptidoglycan hydrolase-like protein with peptidoglycan-binding domain